MTAKLLVAIRKILSAQYKNFSFLLISIKNNCNIHK